MPCQKITPRPRMARAARIAPPALPWTAPVPPPATAPPRRPVRTRRSDARGGRNAAGRRPFWGEISSPLPLVQQGPVHRASGHQASGHAGARAPENCEDCRWGPLFHAAILASLDTVWIGARGGLAPMCRTTMAKIKSAGRWTRARTGGRPVHAPKDRPPAISRVMAHFTWAIQGNRRIFEMRATCPGWPGQAGP